MEKRSEGRKEIKKREEKFFDNGKANAGLSTNFLRKKRIEGYVGKFRGQIDY